MSQTGRSIGSLAYMGDLLRRARIEGNASATARGLTHVAWLCLQLGFPSEGLDCLARARRAWARLDDPAGEAKAMAIQSWLMLELGLVDEAFVGAEAAIVQADGTLDLQVMAFAKHAKAVALLYARQVELAIDLLQECLTMTDPEGQPSDTALYRLNLACCHDSLADDCRSPEDHSKQNQLRLLAIQENDSAITLAASVHDSWNERTALCNGSEYYARSGDLGTAGAYLARWRRVEGVAGLREKAHYLYTKGEVLTLAGKAEEALAVCREAVALSAISSHANNRTNALRRLAEALELAGDHQAALGYYKAFHVAYDSEIGETTRRRAQLAEASLHTERLRERAARLEVEASHDALTGLRNRRSFENAMAAAEGTDFVLGILDLDHFKSINDRFSHLVGDEVLRRCGDLLRAEPEVDAFRLGGEEFALLFCGQDLEMATRIANGLRHSLERLDWSGLADGLSVTASIGLAAASDGNALAIADRRLYLAKSAGRNRVVAAEPSARASPSRLQMRDAEASHES